MQHVYFASKEHDSVCVVADDTDVLVLMLFVSNECTGELFFREGTQSSKKGILYHKVNTLVSHLGSKICSILPAFHSLTGCDFTNPFYGRSKFGSFKNLLKKPGMEEKLSSLSTDVIDVDDVTDFVLRVVYNRPNIEKTLGESRYAMLLVKNKKGGKKFTDTKRLPPDASSLKMKIMQTNYVTLGWVNCLTGSYSAPDPLNYGWKIDENANFVPDWFEGDQLPTNDELSKHNTESYIESIIMHDRTMSDNSSDEDDWVSDSGEN